MPDVGADEELTKLARTLADWSYPFTEFAIYVFGSRVRGDHQQNSDVDIVVVFPQPLPNGFVDWWGNQNMEEFASINASLPGPLKILEYDDPLVPKVLEAGKSPHHRDCNVRCVWLPPKPSDIR